MTTSRCGVSGDRVFILRTQRPGRAFSLISISGDSGVLFAQTRRLPTFCRWPGDRTAFVLFGCLEIQFQKVIVCGGVLHIHVPSLAYSNDHLLILAAGDAKALNVNASPLGSVIRTPASLQLEELNL